jgi:hypothetical protein
MRSHQERLRLSPESFDQSSFGRLPRAGFAPGPESRLKGGCRQDCLPHRSSYV